MFKLIGRIAARHPWGVCAAWLVGGLLLARVAPAWDTKAQDDDIHFLPARCDGVRGYRLLAEAFPQDVFASRLIFAFERPNRPLGEADFELADRCVADLEDLRRDEPDLQLGKVACYRDPLIGQRFVSADHRCTLLQVSLATPFLAQQTRRAVDRAEEVVQRRVEEAGGEAPQLWTTGPAGIGRDLVRASAESLDSTTLATVGLVILVLLVVYRAPLLALIPLVTIGVSVWVALHALALLTLIPGVYLVNVSKVFAIVILYGAGTDYCLFLISRYREELEQGHEHDRAIRRSIRGVGGALAASAGTVVCGLGLMGFAEFAKVRCAGPAIALSLIVALLASLTLAPALLRIMGRAACWPRKSWGQGARTEPTPGPALLLLSADAEPRAEARVPFWERISRGVVARPLLVWCTAALALAPLAILGMGVSPVYKPTGELHPSTASVQGIATIQRHFPAGEIGPVTVLLVGARDWSDPAARALIDHLSRGFARLDNVSEVRSLTQPLGRPLAPVPQPAGKGKGLAGLFRTVGRRVAQGVLNQADRAAQEFYLAQLPGPEARHVTRLDIVLKSDPFEPDSTESLELIQTWLANELPRAAVPLGDVRAECYGVTVNSRDLAQVTEADRKRVNGLVLAAIFLILVIVVRRLWLAFYLLATVLLSYYATLGATTLVGSWWAGRPLGQVDWRVPFFLFTILIAVGEDYNILLITRALQERGRHGASEGTRRALSRTGGTITSCGLIMAGTFATLMLAGLGTLMQIGFALAFGVLLDTFIVRPFLVPAFALLVWREPAPAPTPADVLPMPQAPRRLAA
jgi:RND superfamily putative drug exporter